MPKKGQNENNEKENNSINDENEVEVEVEVQENQNVVENNSINDEEDEVEKEVEVEDSFEVDENNKIIEEEQPLQVDEVNKELAEAGKEMVKDLAKDARTMTSAEMNAEYGTLLFDGFKIPMFEEIPESKQLKEKFNIKDEADLFASDSKDPLVVQTRQKLLPKELSMDNALKAINLLKISDQVPKNINKMFYEKEKTYKKALENILKGYKITDEKLAEMKKASTADATKMVDMYCGSESVKQAKAFMATKTTSPFKIDEFVKEQLEYGNLDNLTNEQREAFLNYSAKKDYDKQDLNMALEILNGPELNKNNLYATLAFAKERLEMIEAQTTIDKSSPLIDSFKKDYNRLRDIMNKKGISNDEFDNLVTRFDFKKNDENMKMVDNAMTNLEYAKILNNSTDYMVDTFYARLAIAFNADKNKSGDDLNTNNLREFTQIMRDLNQYKQLVDSSKEKNEVDKALLEITVSKFYKFADAKGIDKSIIEKLALADEKDLEDKNLKNEPVDKEKAVDAEVNEFRKHLSPEEQKLIDDLTKDDKGPQDKEPFIEANEKVVEKQVEAQQEAEASNAK